MTEAIGKTKRVAVSMSVTTVGAPCGRMILIDVITARLCFVATALEAVMIAEAHDAATAVDTATYAIRKVTTPISVAEAAALCAAVCVARIAVM